MNNSNWYLQRTSAALVGILVVLQTPLLSSSAQTILLEEDFENENGGVGVVNYSDFASFDVISGSVDIIGNDFKDFFPGEGHGLYVDLDGTTKVGGLLRSKTTFSLEPGFVYRLIFDLGNTDQRFGGGSVDNSATVSLADVYSETFDRNGLAPFETITRNFTVASTTLAALEFQEAGGDNLGILIDNISFSFTTNLLGDFDIDLDVDGDDYLIWQQGFGLFDGNATVADGDANGDGFVNNDDLTIWDANFGSNVALPTQAAAVGAIPEPSTSVLVLLGFFCQGLLRRRPRADRQAS